MSFLQGQLTQDVTAVSASTSALYGWATAQGRLLCTGQIIDWRESLWLTVPASLAAAIVKRLRMFVLRAKVTIEIADVALHGATGDVGSDAGFVTRVAGDPGRSLVLADRPALPGPTGGEAAWLLADIRAGIPSIAPATSEAFIPQMVNLDLVGGVSFTKGCYAGQEIVTRTRHLGRVRRRMYRFRCAGEEPIAPGDPVYSPVTEVGKVVAAAPSGGSTELLAVAQIDAADGTLHVDAARTRQLSRLPLPYPIPTD